MRGAGVCRGPDAGTKRRCLGSDVDDLDSLATQPGQQEGGSVVVCCPAKHHNEVVDQAVRRRLQKVGVSVRLDDGERAVVLTAPHNVADTLVGDARHRRSAAHPLIADRAAEFEQRRVRGSSR